MVLGIGTEALVDVNWIHLAEDKIHKIVAGLLWAFELHNYQKIPWIAESLITTKSKVCFMKLVCD